MIKKILFSTLIIISGVTLLNAQCTPGNYSLLGIYPDTATNLPHATVSVPYSTTMTVVVPLDTTYSGMTINIDSIKLTSITGLPTGFTYVPNMSSWASEIAGCVLISGTSVTAGTYPLSINTLIYGKLFTYPMSYPSTVTGYKIIVDAATGIQYINKEKFNVYQNSPNPFSDKTNIIFTSPLAETYQFLVYNLIGEVVYKRNVNADAGINNIEFSAPVLPSGIYMYKLSNNTQTITKRMIIEGK